MNSGRFSASSFAGTSTDTSITALHGARRTRRAGTVDAPVGHTRLRMRAESTPSWSRYFATVRRAIWTPLSLRMLTIA